MIRVVALDVGDAFTGAVCRELCLIDFNCWRQLIGQQWQTIKNVYGVKLNVHQAMQNEKVTCRQNEKAPHDNQRDAKVRKYKRNQYEIKIQMSTSFEGAGGEEGTQK